MSFLCNLSFIPHSLCTLQQGTVFPFYGLNRSYLLIIDFFFAALLQNKQQPTGFGLQVPTAGNFCQVTARFYLFFKSGDILPPIFYKLGRQGLQFPTPGLYNALRISDYRKLVTSALDIGDLNLDLSIYLPFKYVPAPGKLFFFQYFVMSSKIVLRSAQGIFKSAILFNSYYLGSYEVGDGSLEAIFQTQSMNVVFFETLAGLALFIFYFEVLQILYQRIFIGSTYFFQIMYPSTPPPIDPLLSEYSYGMLAIQQSKNQNKFIKAKTLFYLNSYLLYFIFVDFQLSKELKYIQFSYLKMEYRGIFPDSLELPNPFYAIGAFLLSIGLYYASARFVMQKLTEKLYFMSSHMDIINRSQIYYFLLNLPVIIIGIVSLMFHRSLIGVQISLNMDQIQLLLISGYICWTQQSRQTPIRGFVFFRDVTYMIGALAIFGNFYYSGKIQLMYGFIFLGYFVVFYIIQHLSKTIEDTLLLGLGFKQLDQFSCQFLLTKKNTEGNILAIRQSISENREKIKIQTDQFQQMVTSLLGDSKQQRIIKNFGKIFLRIKAGMQIEQQQNNEDKFDQYDQREIIHNIVNKSFSNVDRIQQQVNQEEPKHDAINYSRQHSHQNPMNLSGSNIGLGHEDSAHSIVLKNYKINNLDSINQQTRSQQKQFIEDQQLFEKIIKYAFYPVYLLSKPQGRLRYLSDYIGFFIVAGCMFVIVNSGYYFSFLNSNNLTIVSLVISFFLAYPPMKYFTRISAQNDFDFMNMFLQAGVLKLVIFGLAVTISSFIQQQQFVESGLQNLLLLGIRSITYIILAIFMASKRFATRYTNFRFFIFLFGLEHCARIAVQIIYKNVVPNQLTN